MPARRAKPRRPLPGQPVRGSSSGRPIMVALDLLGRRWALRVLWELREKPASFRVLRERCGGISPTSLNTRLSELRENDIVESTPQGYALTDAGHALLTALAPLHTWANDWLG